MVTLDIELENVESLNEMSRNETTSLLDQKHSRLVSCATNGRGNSLISSTERYAATASSQAAEAAAATAGLEQPQLVVVVTLLRRRWCEELAAEAAFVKNPVSSSAAGKNGPPQRRTSPPANHLASTSPNISNKFSSPVFCLSPRWV